MAGQGQCPHFDIHQGVCGCPEFWKPAQRSQNDQQPPKLREVSNARYNHNAPGNQFNFGVNSIPLPNRTKTTTQPATPAPPGPPKETCFFWYHGSCRRGDDCDRPHEAHPTWPIPPPPGFRHYQSCTLPLCPLRTDLESTKKPQEYHRGSRTMGGQTDGAAFSRATTAGESSSDNDSSNTDTDMSETNEEVSMISPDEILGADTQGGVAAQTLAEDTCKEGADEDSEVKAQQELGSHEFDQSDYVDLSQLIFPPSTPFVQEEPLLSISHSGTLSKRRHLATNSPGINNKRVKLAEVTTPDLSSFVPILERPCNMSQWDIRPPAFSLDGSQFNSGATHLTPMYSFPPQPLPMVAANSEPTPIAAQPFDPPKGPRSMETVPPVCFFYYHKGYCKPKRGRRCDYLHSMNTSQQVVSLPHGIDNHDPTCSLPLCPVRLQSLSQVQQEPDRLLASMQPEIKHEVMTPPRLSDSSFHEYPDSSPRDMTLAVRGRNPKDRLGQPLPQLTGIARQRFKEQKHRIEQIQTEQSIASAEVAAIVDAETQVRATKKKQRRKRGAKKHARANAAEQLRLQMQEEDSVRQGLSGHSDAFAMQRPLPSLAKEEMSDPTLLSPVGDPNKKQRGLKNRNKKPLHNKRAEALWFGDTIKSESVRGFTPETAHEPNPSWALQGFPSSPKTSSAFAAHGEQQVGIDRALDMVDTMDQDLRKWRPLITHPQRTPALIVPYEYSQESLGLTSEERRAQVNKERVARHGACDLGQRSELERVAAAPEVTHLAASAASLSHQHQICSDDQDPVSSSRCRRRRRSKTGCDQQRPCRRCIDAGNGVDGYLEWDGGSGGRKSQSDAAVATDNTAENSLPEGGQRLDWDTDLVRRLFGEI